MVVIACIDEKNGMLFHRRRQSRDRALLEDVAKECSGRKLHMNAYSYAMFQNDAGITAEVSEDFLNHAQAGEFCFIEDIDVCTFREKIEAVILYKWNRDYPADLYFTLDLADGSWQLERKEEFEGFSHKNITKEVYKKKNETR